MARRRRGSNNSQSLLIIVILIICALLFMFKDKKEEKVQTYNGYDSAVIVVGNHKYSPAPNFNNNATFEEIISDIFYNTKQGEIPNISLISATSNPKHIDIEDRYLVAPGGNELASKDNLKTLINGINKASTISPTESGADYFAAIIEACEELKNSKNAIIIVYGSGLSDTGIMNFAFDNIIDKLLADESYVNNMLANNKMLSNKDYSNIKIVWYGAGQTVGEQKNLKEYKKVVEDAYQDMFEFYGMEGEFKSIRVSSNTKSVDTDYDIQKTFANTLEAGDILDLNERYASFYGDQAILMNEDEVREYLKGFSNKLIISNSKVKITGYQTVCAQNENLSIARANTIKKILIELGVSEKNISVAGVAGPPDERVENPRCGYTGIAVEHRTVRIEVVE